MPSTQNVFNDSSYSEFVVASQRLQCVQQMCSRVQHDFDHEGSEMLGFLGEVAADRYRYSNQTTAALQN